MQRIRSGFEFIFASYKRAAALLFIVAILIAIPVTTTFIGQQQDIRQNASAPTVDSLLPQGYKVFDGSGIELGQVVNKSYESLKPTPPALPNFQPDTGWTVFNDQGNPIGQTYLSQSFVTSPQNNQLPKAGDVLYKYDLPSKSYLPITEGQTGLSASDASNFQFTKKTVFDASHKQIGQVYIPKSLIQWYQLWLQSNNNSASCQPKPDVCNGWWAIFFGGSQCKVPSGGWCATTPTPIASNITPGPTNTAGPGQSCGASSGYAARQCQPGYTCQNPNAQQSGGICVPNVTPSMTPIPTLTVANSNCQPLPAGCIQNGKNICQFFAAPPGGWCPISNSTPTPPPPVACPALARLCPDGSSVSASGPNCTFPACPAPTVTPTPGIICAEVITYGKNIATGAIQQFPTACLPVGWIPVSPSSLTPTPNPTATPTPNFTPAPTPTSGPLCAYRCQFGYYLTGSPQNICHPIFGSQTVPAISSCVNNSPTPAPTSASCPLKSRGDANCDGKVNTDDFNIWRDEFLATINHTPISAIYSDFNGSGPAVNTDDFNIWRDGFLDATIAH